MVESLSCDNKKSRNTTLSAIKMLGTPYICSLYVVTAGQQGASLGSDEEEIVLLVYVIIDMMQNKIAGVQQYIVNPSKIDTKENDESILSEQVTTETSLTDDLIRNSGLPLETAIKQFDAFVKSLNIDPASPLFRLVTDGQLPLRQCLHPEACTKNIELPEYYNVFHDLRKDFRTFYNVPNDQELSSITHLVKYLRMTHSEDPQFPVTEIKDMINIIQRLIADGHSFNIPETIQLKLEPGICWKDEEVDDNCVVRARGLPWQSTDLDIAKFFRGLNIAKGGVALCLSQQGRRNGEALVRFINQEHRDMALKRHKHHISNRYIEVYKASGEDFVSVAGGNNNEAQAFLTKGAQVIVRMRGLPYDCTAKQVIEFFENGGEEFSCKVMDGEDGVLFVKKPDGRATGDAFVLFAKEEDVTKALSKHRELIGTRYIELFRSTTAEVQQVLNRTMETAVPPSVAPVTYLPQHVITSGTRKDCIRLRGLPYEASVEHILEFLGEYAKNILFQGVHMVYNSQGHPSGEAFIQMDSEHSAFLAAQMRHHRFMYFGKKQRYIEVFQCSGEDMSHVLFGGMSAPSTPVSPVGKPLLSPGMLNTPTLLPAPANQSPLAAAAAVMPSIAGGGSNSSSASNNNSSNAVNVAAAALVPPQAAAALALDPLSAQVALHQMHQAALVQAQAQAQAQANYRSQQENAWLINQLAAQHQLQQIQQQMQLAAFANAQKNSWSELGAAASSPTLLQSLPSHSVASVNPIVSTAQASASVANHVKQKSLLPSTVLTASSPLHLPQVSATSTAAPFVFINIPRFSSPMSSYPPKVTGVTSASISSPGVFPSAANAAFNIPQGHFISSPAQYVASNFLKRSWEHAFPESMAASNATNVKRSFTMTNQANAAAAMFTMPPPQHPSAQLPPQPSASAVAFQPSQFFAPT